MKLAELRAEVPHRQWTAIRSGFGWEYEGVNDGGRPVRVYPVSVLCGREDDYATEWYVDDGDRTETYASWWLREEHRGKP